uniref:Uncharacterized 21.2 kDa protein in psbX-ycf33 intergenic region n=1 Tax=Cyanophora paradoxa TaxID=2762 RepID=YCXA_CYAPA|nr:hypothetical protein CypaCp116 [Cyanophora paradoxa]P48331.1 RecName: Full=Uncharacterized 21.2 kDa protein in psbX-ycf33 intergenic region; AltName: Full=ORF188 [Cyanophora paradoxa]AAA81284.1 orf188 [Cyanophora paradoxa]
MKTTKSFIIIWTFIGFLLNLLALFTPFELPLFDIADKTNTTYLRMGISFQVASNLFISCVSGATPAKYAQILYLIIGIFGEPLYMTGNSYDMTQDPSWGYVIGSFGASERAGEKAFEKKLSLLNILISSYSGLFVIHAYGAIGLLLHSKSWEHWKSYLIMYSLIPLPSQLVMIFLTSILAFLFRKILD